MKVAIAGYGVEGEANYTYWKNTGHDVTIVDESHIPDKPLPEDAKVLLGEGVFQKLEDFDVVVRTASLPPNAIRTDGEIWSSTNEFFLQCPAPIIGVTGTKGKGTTSSWIAEILRAAGQKVHLIGNIGVPALSVLPEIDKNDIVVFELSSFQLWDLRKSPHVAVVLMIEPDHLDIHADFDDYIRAKSNIRAHQMAHDVCFYHPTNKWSEKIAHSTVLGETERFGHKDGLAVYEHEGYFCSRGEKICSVDAVQIPGAHNIENACAAISAARVFTVDSSAIEAGLRAFHGLPHRLKFVREVQGVKYYNDSIATTPGSSLAAIHAFQEPKLLILGGSDKRSDYTSLIDACKSSGTTVVATGTTGPQIAMLCRKAHVAVHEIDGSMKDIVQKCRTLAPRGSVVLLSPASASFDRYKNYADRGKQFVAAVEAL